MSIGVKSLEKAEIEFTRKMILWGGVIGSVLFLSGLGVMVGLFLIKTDNNISLNVLASVLLTFCLSAGIFHRYYKRYFTLRK